jgi:hypothetical protein
MKKDTRDGSGLIVGVDLGDRFSRYCVLDQKGQVLEEDTVATTGKAFRRLFGDRPAARVVIEVGTHSPWVVALRPGRPCPAPQSQFLGRVSHQVGHLPFAHSLSPRLVGNGDQSSESDRRARDSRQNQQQYYAAPPHGAHDNIEKLCFRQAVAEVPL